MSKFIDVIKKVIDAYNTNKAKLNDAKKDVSDKDIDKSVKAEVKVLLYEDALQTDYKKMVNLFRVLCSSLSKDEFKILEQKFIEMGDGEKLDNLKSKLILNNKNFKNMKPEDIDLSMMYTSFSSGYFHDEIGKYVDIVTSFVGQERCDRLADEILSYDPIEENYVHDFEADINNAKNGLNETNLSDEDKNKYSAILDEINELEYVSKPQSDHVESSLQKLIAKRIKGHVKDYVEKNNLTDYIDIKTSNEAIYKDVLIGDEETIKSLNRHNLEFGAEYKKNLVEVYNKMDQLGLLDSEFVFEQGTKVYGFRRFYDARNNLHDIIKNNDYANLERAKNEYVKQYNNLKEIYAFLREKINPNLLSIPTNMSNLRERYIPKEFSLDLDLNATLNGFYYVFSSLKAAGIDVVKYIDNPLAGSKDIVEKLYSDDYVDNVFKDVSREEKIMRLYSLKNYVTVRGTFRFVENFICHDPDPKDENLLHYSLFVGNDDMITGASKEYGDFYFYDDANVCDQLFNVILTHNDNLEFSELYCKDFKSRDALHIIKAFDCKKYVSEHEVNVSDLISYSKSLLKEMIKLKENGLLNLQGQKLDRKYDYKNMLTFYFPDIAQALMKLANYKDLSITEYDEIYSFVKNPKENLKGLGFSDEELESMAGAVIRPAVFEEFRGHQKFYSALDKFNVKYNLSLDKKIFTDNFGKIDFDNNKFYKEEFIKLFNEIYKNSVENNVLKEDSIILNSNAMSEFATELNDIFKIAINDLLDKNSLSPLETMSNQDKVDMLEVAYGRNRILDVKYDGVSYKEKNDAGFNNLDYRGKALEFLHAYQTISEGIVKFDDNKNYTNDSKKVFLQSYREVFKTMKMIHNKNWFIKMLIHPKDYREEKKMLNNAVNLVSKKLKMERDVVKAYLNKNTDTLYDGSMSEFAKNSKNIKSYTYDKALVVSDTITKTADIINEKYNLEKENLDIIMRSNYVNAQRKNIDNVKLDDNVIKNQEVVDIDVKSSQKSNELN